MSLGELVQEFKAQISILNREDSFLREEAAGLHPTLRRDFFLRYERHRRLFQEMQLERSLDMTYNVTTALSDKVGHEKLQQHRALEDLFNLVERGKLDRLRKCGVCQRWYLGRPNRVVCSKACRQKRHYATPEHNQRRRENYAWKKTQKRM